MSSYVRLTQLFWFFCLICMILFIKELSLIICFFFLFRTKRLTSYRHNTSKHIIRFIVLYCIVFFMTVFNLVFTSEITYDDLFSSAYTINIIFDKQESHESLISLTLISVSDNLLIYIPYSAEPFCHFNFFLTITLSKMKHKPKTVISLKTK